MQLDQEILSTMAHWGKYARHLPQEQRRETWDENVDRVSKMHHDFFQDRLDHDSYQKLVPLLNSSVEHVRAKRVLPSMRSMQFAGGPIFLNPSRQYNCAYQHMDAIEAFAETMFQLLSGTGVGYSVQRRHVDQLPPVQKPVKTHRYKVGDSIEGWSDAVLVLLRAYLTDQEWAPEFDFRDVRPKGAYLVTSGGQAPGPEPLAKSLQAIADILKSAPDGEKLRPIHVHDMNCHSANAVLAGGIRRAAMISLFDRDDEEMLRAKGDLPGAEFREAYAVEGQDDAYEIHYLYKGKPGVAYGGEALIQKIQGGHIDWFFVEEQRGRSNNSAVLPRDRVREQEFIDLWSIIEHNNTGEPGFFWTDDPDMGLNPCAEVSLHSHQYCNLVTTNAGDVESQQDLEDRVRAAAIMATCQAAYTDFHYLRPEWREVTEREALIGVSMTGIASGTVLDLDLKAAAQVVKETNAEIAELLGINKAARTTVIKPEGTSSLVLGTSSGIHAWHDDYYLRRIRLGKNEALYTYLSIHHPELVEDDVFNPSGAVVSIPQKAPDGAITRTKETALDLLERIRKFSDEWILPGHRSGANSNNVSSTVTVKDNEWRDVGRWMWRHRDSYTALAVLPYDGGSYTQAPFETITEEEYRRIREKLTDGIDTTKIVEISDHTSQTQEVACGPAGCDVVAL